MTPDGFIRYINRVHKYLGNQQNGCASTLIVFCIIIMLAIGLSGCSTTKETTTENHSYSLLTDKMDSLMRSTSVWQQEFLSRQTSLIEKFSQKEKNDSSHTVIVNEKGDTVKETIYIYKEVEKDHSKEKEEYDVLMRQYNRIDSLLKVSLDKQAETDSLLRDREKVVEKKLTHWQQAKQRYGGWAMGILTGLAMFFVYRQRKKFILD